MIARHPVKVDTQFLSSGQVGDIKLRFLYVQLWEEIGSSSKSVESGEEG